MNPKKLQKNRRALNITENGTDGIIVELNNLDTKIDSSVEEMNKKVEEVVTLAKETGLSAGPQGEKGDVGNPGYTPIKGVDYKDGEDYILTEGDRVEIATKITVPIVEKVIEKTRVVVKEQPIVTEVTNNITKEVIPDEVFKKLGEIELNIKEQDDQSKKVLSGMKEVDGRIKAIDQRWRGAGLSRVSHDDTLTGDGTPSNPLSVTGGSAVTDVTATLPITSSGGDTPDISTSMATNKLIGRGTAGTGVMEEITLGTNISLSGTTLNVPTGAGGVTTVTATLPLSSTGGATPDISMTAAALATSGYVTTGSQSFGGVKTFIANGVLVTGLGTHFAIASSSGVIVAPSTQVDQFLGLIANQSVGSGFVSTSTGVGGAFYRTMTGTANQVVISNGNGASGNPTFSLPQSIATSSSPTFSALTLTGNLTVDTNTLFVDATSNRVGIGTASPSAVAHVIGTTEQLRLGYDTSNYMSVTTGSAGSTTFALTGTSPFFTFNQNVGIGTISNSPNTPQARLEVCASSGAQLRLSSDQSNYMTATLTSGAIMTFNIQSGTGVPQQYIWNNASTVLTNSFTTQYTAISGATTLGTSHHTVNCTSGTFVVTLPTAVSIAGREYVIKNSGAGVITLNTTSSQTIDGNASGVLTLIALASYTVKSDGANWIIIGKV